MGSFSEENYLKIIFHLEQQTNSAALTTDIARIIGLKAASVSEMLKKLSAKKLITYQKYQGVELTAAGRKKAVSIVRKHRLWEVFLLQKMGFAWDEVHDLAEQLEHIDSNELIDRLDKYLGSPKFDPHGDPIPDKNGKIVNHKSLLLSEARSGSTYILAGVANHNNLFLKHLSELGFRLNDSITVKSVMDYDKSLMVAVNTKSFVITHQVACQLKVVKA
ncbi:MAG: metal-dependent transcriptional regulator [Bacteroidia bacterium]